MDWGARLRAAWRGEVSDADLGALFAATASLDGLQQALADRRLAAQIERVGQDWRALLDVGALAAPLWLADALVGLAGAFRDAATRAHPDHPATTMDASLHDLVAALLAPVEDIVAEVTAALADADRRPALLAPLRVGPGGDIADMPPPRPVPEPYARGLATGARQVHTAAAAALVGARAAITRSPAPNWLEAGLQRLDGGLEAAGARLDMVEVRLPPLLAARAEQAAALAAVCDDLWMVVDAAFVAGQLVADPALLPEAAGHHRERPAAAQPGSAAPVAPPRPPAEPTRARDVALPRIPEGAPSPRPRPDAPAPPEQDFALPAIGGRPDAPAGGPSWEPPAAPPQVALPAIGESSPAGSSEKPDATESRPDGQRPPRDAEGQPFPGLPEIG